MRTIKEIQQSFQSNLESLMELGYKHGFDTLLEDFEQIADSWWNNGFETPAEMLRMEIKKIRGEK